MLILDFEGHTVRLPGDRVMEPYATKYPGAWRGHFVTILLQGSLNVRRIARRETDLLGDWFAIDAPAGVSNEAFARRYAIPAPGNAWYVDRVQGELSLPRGTLLNVGVCAPLFGFPGGGVQGEWLEGPYLPSRIG